MSDLPPLVDMPPPTERSAIPPGIPRNSRGEPYSPSLKTMSPQEKSNVATSMAAIKDATRAGRPWWETRDHPPENKAPPVGGMDVSSLSKLDPELHPIVKRESSGKPFVGYGGTDLSSAPLDENGFPIWSGAIDPTTGRRSHAAGILQIQPGTWAPIAKKLGIKDFSLESQVAVGNELKREQGLKPWDASLPPVVGSGKWQVSDQALAHGFAQRDASVMWMPAEDYLAMLPPLEGDAANKAKRTSLLSSLTKGEKVEDLPSIDVKRDGNKLAVIDYDGRNRAETAMKEGVDLIPVVIRGVGKGDKPTEIAGLSGKSFGFDFKPVAPPPPPARKWWEKAAGSIGTGLADPIVGAAQLAGHAGMVDPEAAAYLPPEVLAEMTNGQGAAKFDKAIQDREQAYQAQRKSEGDTGIDWGRVGGNVIATAPLAALPGAGAIGVGGNALVRGGAAVLGGALAGGAAAAVSPVTTPGNYLEQKEHQVGEGLAIGGALGVVPPLASAGRNVLSSIVSPTAVTKAAARLFGENADRLTPEFLQGVRQRTSATLERIEKGHDIDLDTKLLSDLDSVRADARALLGDENYGGQAAPIIRAVEGIMSRATEDGVIPGKSAATLWHKGSTLDRLTDSANRDVAGLAQKAQNAVRSGLNRQLPPDEAALYSAARNQWRDLKIVEKSLRPGETQLNPSRFATQINRRFPGQASQPGGPSILQLGRAIGETWPVNSDGIGAQIGRRILGHALGGATGFAAGGPVGGAVGTVAGHLALNALTRLRMASPNALRALRPPPQPMPSVNALSSLGRAAQQAPTATAPAMSFEFSR